MSPGFSSAAAVRRCLSRCPRPRQHGLPRRRCRVQPHVRQALGGHRRRRRPLLAPGPQGRRRQRPGRVWSGRWTYRGEGAPEAESGEDLPRAKGVVTPDANGDKAVDWQDGAVAFRTIGIEAPEVRGHREPGRRPHPVQLRQPGHPPLPAHLRHVNRISLATDGLGRLAVLKGYGSEGHDSAHHDSAHPDSAHPDYGGNQQAGRRPEGPQRAAEGRQEVGRHLRRPRQRHRGLPRGERVRRGARRHNRPGLELAEPELLPRSPAAATATTTPTGAAPASTAEADRTGGGRHPDPVPSLCHSGVRAYPSPVPPRRGARTAVCPTALNGFVGARQRNSPMSWRMGCIAPGFCQEPPGNGAGDCSESTAGFPRSAS